MKVIIIGSGIAGLSAAIALRRVGIEVAVYERAPELTEVGAGISLWANALRALDYIGAGDAVRAVSLRMDRSEFRNREGRRITASFSATQFEKQFAISPFVAMTHRAELVAALASCLPPGIAQYGFECVGVEPREGSVTVHFKNGRSEAADVVIGADGIRSAVRSALFGAEEPRYAGYPCWRGVCPRPSSLEPGYIAEWWGRGKRFGITTLTRDRVYWWATENAPAGVRLADEREHVAAAFRSWADPVPELIATTPTGSVLRNDILDRRPTRKWSVGAAGLIGDAAHPTTPNFGQGGCMAVEDSVVLARCLSKNPDPAKALEQFAKERYRRTTGITKESDQFGRIGQWESPFWCGMRDRLFGLVLPLIGSKSLPKHAAFDVGPLT